MSRRRRAARSIRAAETELVIQRAMARQREDRYQTMAELRRALEPFLAAHTSESGVASAPRSAQSSRSLLEADARAVSTARPRLLAYSALALVLAIAGVSSTLPAVELVTGKLSFTRAEVALFILGIVGTLLTPTLIWTGRLRRTVWTNHPRVIAPGFVEACCSRVLLRPRDAACASWTTWHAWLPFAYRPDVGRVCRVGTFCNGGALVMAGVTGARLGIERVASGGFARRATPLLSFAGALVCVFVLYAGFVWRSDGVVERVEAERAAAPSPAPPAADAPAVSPPNPEPAPATAVPPGPAASALRQPQPHRRSCAPPRSSWPRLRPRVWTGSCRWPRSTRVTPQCSSRW